ncbi:hypothetical protein NA56DRAFT_705035 [Hyaloscypha hepaticicola]|uniref:Uncharacterized protein n=1 Tax=Hyaloscypha hepaticicola TaxID=2082293 RepID=A0A2J6Q0J7_9HELO|nr:hypothetical protein NA56DRAFT_705035 [Hyaloscypha hepaticicola]
MGASRFRELIWSVTLAIRAERRQQEDYCDACILFIEPILPSSLVGSVQYRSRGDLPPSAVAGTPRASQPASALHRQLPATQPQRHPASGSNLTCAGHTPAPCSHGCDETHKALPPLSLSLSPLAQLTVQLATSIISLACVLSLLCARHAIAPPMTGPDRMKASARQFQRHRHQKRVVLAHSVHVMGTHRKRASAELPTPCPMFPNASLRASSSWYNEFGFFCGSLFSIRVTKKSPYSFPTHFYCSESPDSSDSMLLELCLSLELPRA